MLRALVRAKMHRHKHPTGGCLDSQSVKTTAVAGVRGFDSGKKVKGRKRHLLWGANVICCATRRDWPWNWWSHQPISPSPKAHAWSAARWAGGVVSPRNCVAGHPLGGVDAGYKAGAIEWCQQRRGLTLEVVVKDKEQSGFVLQKKRWVIERTFAWLSAHRRLAHDYEGRVAHSEALIWIALSRILLKRLA